ncbi:ferredoxin [Saccharomonospora sp. NPDC006951]
MSQPGAPLTAPQRQQLVARIGQAVAAAAPRGWRRLEIEYRAAGRHVEVDLGVTGQDGVTRPAQPPAAAVRLLSDLRAGMYQRGRGTWLGATLTFAPGQPPRLDVVLDNEPEWRRQPPPIGFRDELRFFPRAERYLPEWLLLRADGAPVAGEPPRFPSAGPSAVDEGVPRTPRVYDGFDDSGMPLVERPALSRAERERVLAYLDAAPVVLAARGYDTDPFEPRRPASVPLTFRTDGAWVWPGAVAYHLREHEIAPDPELLTHIRARDFVVPEVGEPARELAIAAITGSPSTTD